MPVFRPLFFKDMASLRRVFGLQGTEARNVTEAADISIYNCVAWVKRCAKYKIFLHIYILLSTLDKVGRYFIGPLGLLCWSLQQSPFQGSRL